MTFSMRNAKNESSAGTGRRPCRGLILDMDGTLFDSEALHIRAWQAALASVGVHYGDEWYQPWIGKPDRDLPAAVMTEHRLSLTEGELLERKGGLYREVARRELIAFEGVMVRLRSMAEAGVPMALCSSSRRDDVDLSLEIAGLAELLPLRVTLEDVAAPKPDPAPYRLSAGRLGLEPGDCLAIEDSPSGVAAALAAGCRTLAVATTHPAEALARAERVFATTPDALDTALSAGWLGSADSVVR